MINKISNFKFQISKRRQKSFFLANGYTLMEILIVVFIFAILMFVVVQTLASTFRSTSKSENEVAVRENIDYAISTIERNLRNARSLTCPNSSTLSYIDQYDGEAFFRCDPGGNPNGRIASGSAYLTTSDVYIDCSKIVFLCDPGVVGVPPSVRIYMEGKNANAGGPDQSVVTSQTTILLRSYDFR